MGVGGFDSSRDSEHISAPGRSVREVFEMPTHPRRDGRLGSSGRYHPSPVRWMVKDAYQGMLRDNWFECEMDSPNAVG